MGAMRKPEERSYGPGEIVRYSGIYNVYHSDSKRAADTIVLLERQTFPPCRDCGGVRFVLSREAPYILEDDDFRSEQVSELRPLQLEN